MKRTTCAAFMQLAHSARLSCSAPSIPAAGLMFWLCRLVVALAHFGGITFGPQTWSQQLKDRFLVIMMWNQHTLVRVSQNELLHHPKMVRLFFGNGSPSSSVATMISGKVSRRCLPFVQIQGVFESTSAVRTSSCTHSKLRMLKM